MTTSTAPLPAERNEAPVIALDALEHTQFHLSPESGYQIVTHEAVSTVLLFCCDSYCGEFDNVEAAQVYIDATMAARAATKRQPDSPRF